VDHERVDHADDVVLLQSVELGHYLAWKLGSLNPRTSSWTGPNAITSPCRQFSGEHPGFRLPQTSPAGQIHPGEATVG
jgi:hypothetical protein